MVAEVDIYNIGLAHIGDIANVSSPSEQSTQAQYCRAFYSLSRDILLESHAWGFATSRISLAEVSNPTTEWKHAYATPNNMLKALAIHAPDAASDYSAPSLPNTNNLKTSGAYIPQPFVIEADQDGNSIILTNQIQATLRYTQQITDSSKFTALFVAALSWHLASSLAGVIIKGKEGAAESKRCLAMAGRYLGQAKVSDAINSFETDQQNVDWLAAR